MNLAGRTALLHNLNVEEQQELRTKHPTWKEDRIRREASVAVAQLSTLSNGKLRKMMRQGKAK